MLQISAKVQGLLVYSMLRNRAGYRDYNIGIWADRYFGPLKIIIKTQQIMAQVCLVIGRFNLASEKKGTYTMSLTMS